MGIFSKKKVEVREANIGSLMEFLGNENLVNLNEKTVLELSGIKNAIDLIGGTVASLPIQLYKKKKNKIERIEDDRLFLLNSEPSQFVQANTLKRDLIKDMLLYGKAYAYIDKKGVKVKGLYDIKSSQMTVTDLVNDNGIITDKRYNFILNNRTVEKNFFNVLEVNYGEGLLKQNREVLSTLIYISAYDNYMFKNAILPSGVLETDGKLTQEGAIQLKKQLENLYGGISKWSKPMILEQGLKWKSINQKPQDLMLDKAKDHAIKDIERLFNLPNGFINNVNNASVDSQNLLFLQRTITPLIVAIEEALNQSLLLESEKKQGYYFKFDVSNLMKMTIDKQIEYVSKGVEKGIYTINEARKVMDLEPFENGDKLMLSLGNVTMDSEGNIEVFNTSQGMDEPKMDENEPQDTPKSEEVSKDQEEEKTVLEPKNEV